jgi:enoyl-CoA hydratase/carnithine racemase
MKSRQGIMYLQNFDVGVAALLPRVCGLAAAEQGIMLMGWEPWVCLTLEEALAMALAHRLAQGGQNTHAAHEDRLQRVRAGPHLSHSTASRGKQARERGPAA